MRFRFETTDILFWQGVIAVIITQFVLCYGAMVCRGYPPLTELELGKMLASPLFVWLPSIFGTRVNRMRGVALMSISQTVILAMIWFNWGMIPSIGHLAGPMGILRQHWIEILFLATLFTPFTFFALYFYERVTGDLWRIVLGRPTKRMTFSETWTRAWRFSQSA
jgi:hypothetical protein